MKTIKAYSNVGEKYMTIMRISKMNDASWMGHG
jgi:hypothetical protein